jgi:hypothetical protein
VDREHVLSEIRRTAEANGGRPLGSRRFFLETGIRSADWCGKFWARWSDALAEAGYSPNTMQTPYDEQFLLESYADLAHQLGRLPAANDLRLRHRQDPAFPDAKVFDRLGSKGELCGRVAAMLRLSGEQADVLQMCEGYVPRKRHTTPAAIAPSIVGSVYLIKSGRHFKVGRSNSAARRHYELSIQLPERATLVHVIDTDDPIGIEAYWHTRFASKRLNGEWFNLEPADLAAFKRRKFM